MTTTDYETVQRFLSAATNGTAREQQAALDALDRMQTRYLRLCRDYTISTSGWGQVPDGSQMEGFDAQHRLAEVLDVGASDEAKQACL